MLTIEASDYRSRVVHVHTLPDLDAAVSYAEILVANVDSHFKVTISEPIDPHHSVTIASWLGGRMLDLTGN